MNRPNLNNILECFISIPDGNDSLELWNNYIDCLRSRVIPLIKELREKGLIEWYSFLVHGNKHISPTYAGPSEFYVHLRVEIAENAEMKQILEVLPDFCLEVSQKNAADLQVLDKVEVSTLRDGMAEEGWRILGEASEWVLRLIEGHDPKQEIPTVNVLQFVHYLNNSIMGRNIGISI